MHRRFAFVPCLAAAVIVYAANDPLRGDDAAEKTVAIKIKVPEAEAKVAIDGKEAKGTGESREITAKTKKDTLTISVIWEPNNYTKITRKWKVKTAAEIDLDMTKADPKQPDDIVVRFVPTPDDMVDEMCKLAKVSKKDVVYDLGCGDGRMVIRAVKYFHAKRGVGVELDPDLVKKCKETAKAEGLADKVEFRLGDVLKVKDISDADVVLLYMGDDINNRLKPILQSTLKPGARVVSHRFTMGEWKPDRTETVNSSAGYECLIHLWTIKKKDE